MKAELAAFALSSVIFCSTSLGQQSQPPKTGQSKNPTASEIKSAAAKAQASGAKVVLQTTFSVQWVCAGPIPSGWVVIAERWSPVSCENPTSITYNLWEIEDISQFPVNTQLDICSGFPLPANWVVVASHWNPTTCGNPSSITNNVATIRKL